ncbi:oxysterol-binding protein-related protein 1-like isoform X2 [Liolophura sinensis]
MIKAAVSSDLKLVEDKFLTAARYGDISTMTELMSRSVPPNKNCTDIFGNTALHIAAQRDRKDVAIFLLQHGIDTSIKNIKGQRANSLARSVHMKQLLGVRPQKDHQTLPQRWEGPVAKKSKLMGYRVFWVVLERGVLSYFRNRGDASTGVKRKLMKYLDQAKVTPEASSKSEFKIEFSDGTTHRLAVEVVNGGTVNRQKLLNALQDHVAYSTHYTCQGGDFIDDDKEDDQPAASSMFDALQTARAHHEVLEKEVAQMAVLFNSFHDEKQLSKPANLQAISQRMLLVLQCSRETSHSLSNCLSTFTHQEEVRKLQLKEEMEKSRVLEEALHALATEHHEMERSLGSRHSLNKIYDTDDDEFYDCTDEEDANNDDSRDRTNSHTSDNFEDAHSFDDASFHTINGDGLSGADLLADTHGVTETGDHCQENVQSRSKSMGQSKQECIGRTRLPVPMFSRNDFSIWSILKQCIGKELSKITMPVIFNEPLSFLQRLSEYLQYADLINDACKKDDDLERMQLVCAFAVSAISSNWERTGKPFNPLLGETYELNRPDLNFCLASEQVSHHPPVSAFHVLSPDYTFHGSTLPKLKFWGKSVEVVPKGTVTLNLLKHKESYSWQNVNCCVHNVVVGKLWVEHYGVMEVVNHKTGWKAKLNFKQGGWFGKDLHAVEGYIYDAEKRKVKALYGNWVKGLFAVNVDQYTESVSSSGSRSEHSTPRKSKHTNGSKHSLEDDDIPRVDSHFDLNIPGQQCLWRAHPRPCHSEQYFNFTTFAMMLNELTDEMREGLPPTDSRLRPDIRHLEEGMIDLAAEQKNRLEEKQRAARKERKKKKEEWVPTWFHWDVNPVTGKEDWLLKDDYWQRKWDTCPDIF